MAIESAVNFELLELPEVVSIYESMGRAYGRHSYSVSLLPRLVRTGFMGRGANFYTSVQTLAEMIKRGELPEDTIFSKSGEEHQIYVSRSAGAERLLDIEELGDYLGQNRDRWFAYAYTSTALRVQKGWENNRKDNGTKKYPRTVIETDIYKAVKLLVGGARWEDIGDCANKEVGELQIPYSQGNVIREMDPVFGIFTDVEDTAEHNTPFALHGWLETNPPLDNITGHYDVAVGRRGRWRHGVDGGCLDVGAGYGRLDAGSNGGFRPVRGSRPEIDRIDFSAEQIRKALLQGLKARGYGAPHAGA